MPTGIIGNLKGRIEGLVHDWHSNDDEFFYGIVAEELEQNNIQKGLWLKAMSKTDMNEDKARALYIKMRIASVRKTIFELANARGIAGELLSGIAEKSKELLDLEEKEVRLNSEADSLAKQYATANESLDEAGAGVAKLQSEYDIEKKKYNYRYVGYGVLLYLVITFGVTVLAYTLDLPKGRILAEEIDAVGYWVFNLSNPYFSSTGLLGIVIVSVFGAPLASNEKYQDIYTRYQRAVGTKNKATAAVVNLDYRMKEASRKAKDASRNRLLISSELEKLQTTLDDALAF